MSRIATAEPSTLRRDTSAFDRARVPRASYVNAGTRREICAVDTRGRWIAPLRRMKTMRTLAVLAAGLAVLVVVRSPERRALLARKLAEMRRIVSRRVVDRDAREHQGLDTWNDEGGAMQGASNATLG